MNNFEGTKKTIEKEYKDNYLKIKNLKSKLNIMSANSSDERLLFKIFGSVVAMIPTTFFMPTIIENFSLPLSLVQPLYIGIPILSGVVIEELIAKKMKYKQKLQYITNAKSQREQIEESTKFEIEQEKLKKNNEVLIKVYDCIVEDEKMINSLSDKYNITEKENDNRTADEVSNNIEKISEDIVQKQEEIGELITKRVLRNKFWRVRDRFQKISDTIFLGGVGIAAGMILYNLPLIYLAGLEDMALQVSALQILVPGIIGGVLTTGYGIKRRKDYKDAFNNLNRELCENTISNISNYEEEKQLDKDLEQLMSDVCTDKLQLEQEKRKLEILSLNESNNSKQTCNNQVVTHQLCRENSLDNELTTEPTKKEKNPVLVKKINPTKK